MTLDPHKTFIYHITDVSNIPSILLKNGLLSDAAMIKCQVKNDFGIAHNHIKERRLNEIQVPCCDGRFVGEFVPFYFCPRSPMLYTVNRGNTGREPGCQTSVVHLVSTVARAIALGQGWAFSSGNAGARHADFFSELQDMEQLDWDIIRSRDWAGELRRNSKASEFLVADFFPWSSIIYVGCHNDTIARDVERLISKPIGSPKIEVRNGWYY